MKHTLLLFGMVLSFHIIFAQKQLITDFESWEPVAGWPGVEEPTGWTTLNPFEAKQNRRAVNKSTYAMQGTYALEIVPIYFPSDTSRISQAILGRGNFVDSTTREFTWWGSGIRIRSFELYGYYRFSPDSNVKDSAWIEVFQRRGDNNGYFGSFTFKPNLAYQIFRVGTIGFPIMNADTFSVALFYRTSDTSSNPKGRLWIDFLSTYNPNSTQELIGEAIQCYPNPNTTGLLHLRFPEEQQLSQQATLTIWNALGQSVKNSSGVLEQLQGFNIQGLPDGCYVVEVTTDKGFTYRSRLVYQPH